MPAPGGSAPGGYLLGGVPALGGCLFLGVCSRGGVAFCYGLLIESDLLLWPSGVIFCYGLLLWPSGTEGGLS